VTATDKASNKKETIEIKDHGTGRLTEEQIKEMIKEAEKMSEEDKIIKAKIDAKNSLENYIY